MPVLSYDPPVPPEDSADTGAWRNRIVESAEEDPTQLAANPRNWRIHPQHQQDALIGALDRVGWVARVIVNKRSGYVVDGHARVAIAISRGEPTVPVDYVDLTDEEEALVLATFDPISALAVADQDQLRTLLEDVVQQDDETLRELLDHVPSHHDVLAELDGEQPQGEGDAEGVGEDGQTTPELDEDEAGRLLALVDVAEADPRHQPRTGDVYRLGEHVLIVCGVLTDWPQWVGYLKPGSVFAPYPNPMLPLTRATAPLVMVQPDEYVAGHLLDKWADVHGPKLLKPVDNAA